MRTGYALTIEQTQKLAMTPELVQAIKILQFNAVELEAYVQEQLLSNPVLEAANTDDHIRTADDRTSSDIDWMDYIKKNKSYEGAYRQGTSEGDDRENNYEQYTSASLTLREHLLSQLYVASIDRECLDIGKYIIESLDENGYMTETASETAEATGVSEQIIEKTIDVIRTFEPVGVCARDLAECLMIQLMARGELTEPLEKVISEHLGDLADNRLAFISKSVGISVEEVQSIGDMIKTLEPKPGRQFASQETTSYVMPDIIVEKSQGQYSIRINDSSVPKVVVNEYYEKLLEDAEKDSELAGYLSEKFNSALWLVKSIEQRKQTIKKIAEALVKHQVGFFENGPKALKGLTLKQVAEEVGVHESTVSRTVNGKYLQCEGGVFELKYFFSAELGGEHGQNIASTGVKSIIAELVEQEDRMHPLSDQSIADQLKEKGIDISRRTVAKYRDELGILSSAKRKRY